MIHCNHVKECKCDQYRVCIPGTITNIDYHKYYGQLSPEYEFKQNDNLNTNIQGLNGNGWCHAMQISESDRYESLSVKDIVLYNIRRCIYNDSSKYLESGLLAENEYPLDIKINSAFFGKFDKLQEAEKSIVESLNFFTASTTFHVLPKSILYQYVKKQFQIKSFWD